MNGQRVSSSGMGDEAAESTEKDPTEPAVAKSETLTDALQRSKGSTAPLSEEQVANAVAFLTNPKVVVCVFASILQSPEHPECFCFVNVVSTYPVLLICCPVPMSTVPTKRSVAGSALK